MAAAIAATVAAGLASRKWPWILPTVFGKYPGDVLWAQMVYWGVAFLWPSAAIRRVAGYALGFSFADEISQIYHAPWIDSIRATTAGHLVLGAEFSWGDMLSYAIGIALCAALEASLRHYTRRA